MSQHINNNRGDAGMIGDVFNVLARSQHTGWNLKRDEEVTVNLLLQCADLRLTHSVSRALREKVAGLGQSLDELGDALSVALLGPQRAHHGGQHSLHDASEQLRAQRVST